MLNRWSDDRLEKREALLSAVSSISDIVARNVSFGEEHCYLHPDSWDAIHDSGLLSLKLPSEIGGAEADPVTQLEVLTALASIDTSAAWGVGPPPLSKTITLNKLSLFRPKN